MTHSQALHVLHTCGSEKLERYGGREVKHLKATINQPVVDFVLSEYRVDISHMLGKSLRGRVVEIVRTESSQTWVE